MLTDEQKQKLLKLQEEHSPNVLTSRLATALREVENTRAALDAYAAAVANVVLPVKVGEVTDDASFREAIKPILDGNDYVYIPHGQKNKIRVIEIHARWDGHANIRAYYRGVVLKKDGTDSLRTTGWSVYLAKML